jgi:hypothetical protein
MPRAVADITYLPASFDLFRESLARFPVEWLALKLAINPASVFLRNVVLALANCGCAAVDHSQT